MNRYVMTVGVFDGVHIGHQQLLNRVKESSLKLSCKSKAYVISYPFEYFLNEFDGLIMPLTDRILQVSKFVDEVEVLDLLQIKDIPAEDFFDRYLLKNCSSLIVGKDFRFGKDASADVTRLKKMCDEKGIELEIFPEVFDSQNRRVSSSLIRKLILNGHIDEASKLLGREFCICGSVEKITEGSEKGFVIHINDKIVRPKNGIFEAFERNFRVNGLVKFDDKVTFISKDLHAPPCSILKIVLSKHEKEAKI
ncbi:MAG: hypothetical protein ACK4E2_05715 [Pseudothermotoga sp.]